MKYKECTYCNLIMWHEAPCCPDCGIDEKFTPVSNGMLSQSARMRNMLESVRLGGSMEGWSNEVLDEIDKILKDSK